MIQIKLCLDEDTKIYLGMTLEDAINTLDIYCNKNNYILEQGYIEDKDDNIQNENLKFIKIYESNKNLDEGIYKMNITFQEDILDFSEFPVGSYIEIDGVIYSAVEVLEKYKNTAFKIAYCKELDKEVDCELIKDTCDRARNRGCDRSCSKRCPESIDIRVDYEYKGIIHIIIADPYGETDAYELCYLELEI